MNQDTPIIPLPRAKKTRNKQELNKKQSAPQDDGQHTLKYKLSLEEPNAVSEDGVTPLDIKTESTSKEATLDVTYESDKRKMEKLIEKSSKVLFKTQSSRLFQVFPDVILIDETKVDVIYKHFPFAEERYSMLIGNIRYVGIAMQLFWASIYFEVKGHEENPPRINHLPKEEALKARRIIYGLMSVINEKIDLAKLPDQDLILKLEEIGKSTEDRIKS